MNLLRKLRGQDAQSVLRSGYYTGNFTPDWHEEHFREFDSLPPDRTMFCQKCGAPARWMRSSPRFNVRDGRPGHEYTFHCSTPPDWTQPWYERESHYDSHKYLWLARNDQAIDTDGIRAEDYA